MKTFNREKWKHSTKASKFNKGEQVQRRPADSTKKIMGTIDLGLGEACSAELGSRSDLSCTYLPTRFTDLPTSLTDSLTQSGFIVLGVNGPIGEL